ncbi:MAG: riboflavin kinase [Helicobacteraceae bacterium]
MCVVEDVQLEGASIHATDIISLVRAGELKRANFYLGRAYMLEGAVIRGQGLGAKSLYPTINLQAQSGYAVPKEGVYVGQTEIFSAGSVVAAAPSEQSVAPACKISAGGLLPSVIFVGHRLSTDDSFCIETHILNGVVPAQAATLKLHFIDFLRENKKFAKLSELKAAITADIDKARSYFPS